MPSKNLKIEIYTPYNSYFVGYVKCIHVQTSDYLLGIYPGHAPLIGKVIISKLELEIDEETLIYAVGNGLIRVENNLVTLLVDTIENSKEIDENRALEAKNRALKRLENKDNNNVDVARAKAALNRALNRLNVIGKEE